MLKRQRNRPASFTDAGLIHSDRFQAVKLFILLVVLCFVIFAFAFGRLFFGLTVVDAVDILFRDLIFVIRQDVVFRF